MLESAAYFAARHPSSLVDSGAEQCIAGMERGGVLRRLSDASGLRFDSYPGSGLGYWLSGAPSAQEAF